MKKNKLWILILLITLGSCSNKHAEVREEAMATPVTLEDVAEPNSLQFAEGSQNKDAISHITENNRPSTVKIIKRGNVSIESKDITQSKKNLDNLLKRFSAYYEQESSNNSNEFTTYNLTIRVPANSFDNFLIALDNGKDKLTQKNITAEDVSLQYYDVESRLKSKRGYLARYQELVSSAKNVKDLLEIQEQIRHLQEEIDSNEAILKNLSTQINYSTLTINLFEYQANLPMGSNLFWVKIKDSLVFGWNMAQTVVLGIIGLWPVWIIAAVVVVVIRKLKRSWKKRIIK